MGGEGWGGMRKGEGKDGGERDWKQTFPHPKKLEAVQ